MNHLSGGLVFNSGAGFQQWGGFPTRLSSFFYFLVARASRP